MFKTPINRLQYFERILPLGFIWQALLIYRPFPAYMHWLAVLTVLALTVFICGFTAQRLRDMGRSPWLSLLMVVPGVFLFVGIWCLVANTKVTVVPLADAPVTA